ncbi:MAG: hypothetical protein K8F56_15830 [Rhodocyclaceae bacterium]|nr:hypothetical protein [Rhodocyclaceae bacterium]
MSKLTTMYEKLTPDERVSAFIDAAARRDGDEMDRLNDTCPRKTYTMEDWRYVQRKNKAFMLTTALYGDAARLGFAACFGLGLTFAEDDEMAEKGEKVLSNSVRRYKAKMAAFGRFCDQAGLTADALRKAIGGEDSPAMDLVISVSDEVDPVEPTEEEIRRELDPLLEVWRNCD